MQSIYAFAMTLSTYWDLLAIDGCQVEREALHSLSAFSDVPNVVHLNVVAAATNRAVVQQPGPGPSWPPDG